MADFKTMFGDFGGAVSDIFGGLGALKEAGSYTAAANLAAENARFAEESTAVQEEQVQRAVETKMGAEAAATSGAGFSYSGSAQDLMRESAQQGAYTKALTELQGTITAAGYQEQSAAYQNAASAAKTASTGSFIGGAIKAVSGIASLFM